jgi:hypothetical protein
MVDFFRERMCDVERKTFRVPVECKTSDNANTQVRVKKKVKVKLRMTTPTSTSAIEVKTTGLSGVPVSVKGASVSAKGAGGVTQNPDIKSEVNGETREVQEACVYVLTGVDCREYPARGGGEWTVRSTFAVCSSIEKVLTILCQNATAETWYGVACYKVALDRLFPDVDAGYRSIICQPFESGERVNLPSLIATDTIPEKDREMLLFRLDAI